MKQDNMPQVAKFWNTIAHDFDAIYSGEKSPFARTMDRWLRKDIYQRFDWVMERAGDIKSKSVCDIGCGSGRFVNELARRGASRVLGIDVAPEMLKLARQLVDQHGVGKVCEFVHTDVLNWKPKEQFDLVIAIGFWDYIAEPAERLQIIRKMTGKNGTFLSAWPRFWTWRMPVRKVRLTVQGCPVYFFPKPKVYQLLQSAGFTIERCDVVGKLFCVESRPV
jgi:2-polyprenyl-3-methyl-5-hydroxy-6-metoxy-1,4-benzoquinol methylase